jgi:hypothetical protein
MTPRAIRFPVLLASIALAACQPEFEADLAADPMDDATRVTIALDGVELEREDGTTVKIERKDTALPNLMSFDGDQSFELVTDNSAKKGTFTGIRLLYANNGSEFVGEDSADEIDIKTPDSEDEDFVPLDFKNKDGDKTIIMLVMDLRLSLQAHEGDDYTLSPVLRAVRPEDEADVAGNVPPSLRDGVACTTGGMAVYAFEGADVDVHDDTKPAERDGTDPEPFATAPVSTTGFYHLIALPAGKYTLAFTCDGEHENGLGVADSDEGIRFANKTHNVTLKDGESEQQDF